MGYNSKNARNGKGDRKKRKRPSLRPLELKGKFIRKFNFRKFRGIVWKILMESEVLLSNNFFHTNLLLFKIQTVIYSHFVMMGSSNMAILKFPRCFFPFLALFKF